MKTANDVIAPTAPNKDKMQPTYVIIPKANLSAFGTWENKASKSKLGQFDKSVKDRLRSCRVHVNNIENSDFGA